MYVEHCGDADADAASDLQDAGRVDELEVGEDDVSMAGREEGDASMFEPEEGDASMSEPEEGVRVESPSPEQVQKEDACS